MGVSCKTPFFCTLGKITQQTHPDKTMTNNAWFKNVLGAFLVMGTLLTFSACANDEPDVNVEEVEPIEPVAPIMPDTSMMMDTTMSDTGLVE